MRSVEASGTVDRLGAPFGAGATAAPDAVAHLPGWARRSLPLTRAHPPGGWFLALMPASAPSYAGRRAYLNTRLASRGDVAEDVAAAAAALVASAEAATGAPPGAAEKAALVEMIQPWTSTASGPRLRPPGWPTST